MSQSVEVRTRYNVAPGDEVLAVTTDPRGPAARGAAAVEGAGAVVGQTARYGAEDDQRPPGDRHRASRLPGCVRALSLPDHRRRLL